LDRVLALVVDDRDVDGLDEQRELNRVRRQLAPLDFAPDVRVVDLDPGDESASRPRAPVVTASDEGLDHLGADDLVVVPDVDPDPLG